MGLNTKKECTLIPGALQERVAKAAGTKSPPTAMVERLLFGLDHFISLATSFRTINFYEANGIC